ncbi:hypothetical protein AHAS_Ahas15G0357100 [Arachis hypogaea]
MPLGMSKITSLERNGLTCWNFRTSGRNQMHRGKFSLTPRNEVKGLSGSNLTSYKHSNPSDPIDLSSSDDENDTSNNDISKQLVLYDPTASGRNTLDLFPGAIQCTPPLPPRSKPPSTTPRILPSVGAFTVQCASCFKWRLIPTKEKYEEIREHLLEQPFICQKAREWRPDVSCDDPEDISQDGSRVWAIDKPNIAQPPAGWERLLRIRAEGSTKFADVYYVAPNGKRLRSMVEVQKFLLEHPEYIRDGVTLSQFSFQIPKPLQENYVRKRSLKLKSSYEDGRPVEPEQVSPLAWAAPEDTAKLHEEKPVPFAAVLDDDYPLNPPTKKRATESSLQKDVPDANEDFQLRS